MIDEHVSSHAPVRGHLPTSSMRLPPDLVSSHAPVRGHRNIIVWVCDSHMFQVMPP